MAPAGAGLGVRGGTLGVVSFGGVSFGAAGVGSGRFSPGVWVRAKAPAAAPTPSASGFMIAPMMLSAKARFSADSDFDLASSYLACRFFTAVASRRVNSVARSFCAWMSPSFSLRSLIAVSSRPCCFSAISTAVCASLPRVRYSSASPFIPSLSVAALVAALVRKVMATLSLFVSRKRKTLRRSGRISLAVLSSTFIWCSDRSSRSPKLLCSPETSARRSPKRESIPLYAQ